MPRKKIETTVTEEITTETTPIGETVEAKEPTESPVTAETAPVDALPDILPTADEMQNAPEPVPIEPVPEPNPPFNLIAPRQTARPSNRVITVDGRMYESRSRQADTLAEIRREIRQNRILTGNMYSVETTPSGMPFAAVMYKDLRVIIPADELIDLAPYEAKEDPRREINGVLNTMFGAEIDFIPKGVDERNELVTGSRLEAMKQLRSRFYIRPTISGQPLLLEGGLAEAKVISVSPKIVTAELFGVDTLIPAQELSWSWVADAREVFHVGDRIVVRIMKIRITDDTISLKASVRHASKDPFENIESRIHPQQNYVGTIKTEGYRTIRVTLMDNLDCFCPFPDWMHTVIPGTMVSVKVTYLNLETRRISGRILRVIQEA